QSDSATAPIRARPPGLSASGPAGSPEQVADAARGSLALAGAVLHADALEVAAREDEPRPARLALADPRHALGVAGRVLRDPARVPVDVRERGRAPRGPEEALEG